ncbi:hypothetical protein HY045_02855 [Candidatus Woesebacteria bacterium]|nr:hypothetical protein [Candidatus Woesebacteria bacterium]
MLIFAGASMTEGRRAYAGRLIRGWARALSVAWEEYFQKSAPPKLSYDFSLDNVGVWTTLPEGEWFRASDAAIGRFV